MDATTLKSSLFKNDAPPIVLVCDDNADTRTIIRASIEALGANVIEAENGQQALETCRSNLPDAIIMDIMMPVMSGSEFVKAFRQEFEDPFVPIMMVTALSDVETKVEGLESGADDYVVKPFNARELQARVVALLRTKQLTARLHKRTKQLQETQAALVAKERELVAMQLAGAASHKLKQPIQSILLHCHLIRTSLKESASPEASNVLDATKIIQSECNALNDVLVQLEKADPNQTSEYVGKVKIVEIKDSE
ncbi:MAG: response regulator transcription factor [Bdellovibrionales bacterium]|nr:response regulator transcription factor [Bdellovibrionales bacterium]